MNNTIKHSILLFFIILIILYYKYPNLFKQNYSNNLNLTCITPSVIIIVSIFSYYIIAYSKYILNIY